MHICERCGAAYSMKQSPVCPHDCRMCGRPWGRPDTVVFLGYASAQPERPDLNEWPTRMIPILDQPGQEQIFMTIPLDRSLLEGTTKEQRRNLAEFLGGLMGDKLAQLLEHYEERIALP